MSHCHGARAATACTAWQTSVCAHMSGLQPEYASEELQAVRALSLRMTSAASAASTLPCTRAMAIHNKGMVAGGEGALVEDDKRRLRRVDAALHARNLAIHNEGIRSETSNCRSLNCAALHARNGVCYSRSAMPCVSAGMCICWHVYLLACVCVCVQPALRARHAVVCICWRVPCPQLDDQTSAQKVRNDQRLDNKTRPRKCETTSVWTTRQTIGRDAAPAVRAAAAGAPRRCAPPPLASWATCPTAPRAPPALHHLPAPPPHPAAPQRTPRRPPATRAARARTRDA